MVFPIQCKCGKRFEAKSGLIGKALKCPACASVLKVERPAAKGQIPVKCVCGGSFAAPAYLAKESVPCPSCGAAIEIKAPAAKPVPTPKPNPKSTAQSAKEDRKKARAAAKKSRAASPTSDELFGNLEEDSDDLFESDDLLDDSDDLGGFDSFQSTAPVGGAKPKVKRKSSSSPINMPLVIGSIVACGVFILACLVIGNMIVGSGVSDDPDPPKVARVEPDPPRRKEPATETNSHANARNPRSEQDRPEKPATEQSTPSVANKPNEADKDKYDPALGSKLAGTFQKWEERSGAKLEGATIPKDVESVLSGFSWMTKLLPHLGYQEIYDGFYFDQSWMSKKNFTQAVQVIPEFQNPLNEQDRWKGYPFKGIALSHFVGISGVEKKRTEVAAKFPRKHPRAGVFGYKEVMKTKDVTDGASHTISMIGAGELAGPWAAGGGATVRGARQPHFGGISGFGSVGAEGKGAVALRVDGSAKFVSNDIDPKVFEAMCTAHGEDGDIEPGAWQEAPQIAESKQKKFRKTNVKEGKAEKSDSDWESHDFRKRGW